MVSLTNLSNFIGGWGTGYQFNLAKSKEDEIRQGANDLLAAFPQAMQANLVTNIIKRMIYKTNSPSLPTKIFLSAVPFLNLIAFSFMGAVRQGKYDEIYRVVQTLSPLQSVASLFPKKLSERTIKIINYIAENFGNVARITVIALSGALIVVMGDRVFGATLLAGLAYGVIDQRLGLVPHRVSLFIETYMPMISVIALVVSRVLTAQFFDLINLAFYFEPSRQMIYQIIDFVVGTTVHGVFWMLGKKDDFRSPSLREIRSTVQENKNLSFDVIQKILRGNDNDFEINPAHCVRATMQIASLPESRAFDDYLVLFNTINWDQKFDLIKKKCKSDKRFKKANVSLDTDQELVVSWFKAQMSGLVDGLMGRRRMEGNQQDIHDAIQNCAKILPYLQSLDPGQDRIEIEDTLLALTVEGGYYCARGVKRCSNDLLRKIFYRDKAESFDSQKDYELKISQTLEDHRAVIVETAYKACMEEIKIPDVIASDVHGFDLNRKYFTLPFFPMTDYEKYEIGLVEVIVFLYWRTLGIYQNMYRMYRTELDAAIYQHGEVHFGIYMRSVINQNSQLTPEQKEAVLELYTGNKQPWASYSTELRFHRLMLVMHGVLRQRTR